MSLNRCIQKHAKRLNSMILNTDVNELHIKEGVKLAIFKV